MSRSDDEKESTGFQAQCCVCMKIRLEGQWQALQPEARTLVTHTYCPACLSSALST